MFTPLAALLEECRVADRGKSRAIFQTVTGVAWHRSTASLAFNRLRDQAGLRRDLVVHSIRHTAASWLAISGAPLRTIQEIAGHGSITSTMRYAHLSPEHLKGHLAVLG